MNWYLAAWKKYAVFGGRARRKEYWLFALPNAIILSALKATSESTKSETSAGLVAVVYLAYSLAALIPALAVSVRRLHDIGKSGWWLLIGLVPLIGWIILLIFLTRDSQEGPNQYGPNPKLTQS